MDDVRQITEKIDIVASELEKKHPELALALDLVSDKIERYATVPGSLVKLHKDYMRAGGQSTLDHFLAEDIPGFLASMGKGGEAIWEWDRTKGPASK